MLSPALSRSLPPFSACLSTSNALLGLLTDVVRGDHVSQGFQASATFHQGDIIAAEAGASGELKSTVASYVPRLSRSNASFSVCSHSGHLSLRNRSPGVAGSSASSPGRDGDRQENNNQPQDGCRHCPSSNRTGRSFWRMERRPVGSNGAINDMSLRRRRLTARRIGGAAFRTSGYGFSATRSFRPLGPVLLQLAQSGA